MNIDITNIRNINYIEVLEKSIAKVREEYKDLDEHGTCKIYSQLLAEELKKYHVPYRLVTMEEYNINFDHMFLLIPYNTDFILCDLTFSQFSVIEPVFVDLLDKGYQIVNKELFNEYLSIFNGDQLKDENPSRSI